MLFTMLTGYGISEFRTVSSLTFGILGKATSQRLHHYTDIPMLIFLSVHIGITLWVRLVHRGQGVARWQKVKPQTTADLALRLVRL